MSRALWTPEIKEPWVPLAQRGPLPLAARELEPADLARVLAHLP